LDQKLTLILAELRRELQSLYGELLADLVLYGSCARGAANGESDIDVLVVLEGDIIPCEEIARTEEIVAGLSLANDVVVSCVFVPRTTFESKSSPLLLNVRREGVQV
jgi:predicted nucleotidyltransferase